MGTESMLDTLSINKIQKVETLYAASCCRIILCNQCDMKEPLSHKSPL